MYLSIKMVQDHSTIIPWVSQVFFLFFCKCSRSALSFSFLRLRNSAGEFSCSSNSVSARFIKTLSVFLRAFSQPCFSGKSIVANIREASLTALCVVARGYILYS